MLRSAEKGAGVMPNKTFPTWIRCTAAIAVAAFVLSFLGGLLGAGGWWQASGVVFAVTFGVVWAYKLRHERDAAIDFGEDRGDSGEQSVATNSRPVPPTK